MPRYLVQDPDSGRSLLLEGDSEPTEQELNDIFKSYSATPDAAPAPAQEPAQAPVEAPEPAPQEPQQPTPAPLVSNPKMQAKLGLSPIDISQKGPRKSYAENALTPEEREEAVRRETWDSMSLADRASQSIARGAQSVGRAAGGMVRGIGTVIDKGAESALAQEGFLDEAAQLRQRTGEQKLADRETMPLVQAGRAIDRATEKSFPYEKPEKATDVAGATLEAVGSIVPPLLLAPVGGTAGALAAGTLMEFDDAYEREIQGQQKHGENIDPDMAFRNAAKYAAVTVPIELSMGIGRILGNIKKYFGADAALQAGKKAIGGVPALAEFTRERMKDAGAGFVQEFAEATAQNLIIDGQPQLANAFREGVMGLVGQTVVGAAAQGTAMAAGGAIERADIRRSEKEMDKAVEGASAYRDRLAQIGADPVVQQVAPLTAAVLTDQAQVTPPNVGKETPIDQPETTEQRLTREAQPAIQSFNAAKQAEAESEGETVELYHGSVGRRDSLRPGTMLTNDPAWAAGYATKTETDMTDTFVGTVHKAKVSFKNPIYVRSLHDAEAKLIELAQASGRPSSTLQQAAEIVAKTTGYDAIVAMRDGKVVGAIPLTESPVVGTLAPTEAVDLADKEGRTVPDNVRAAYARAKQQPTQPEGGVDQSEEEGQKEGVQVTPTEPTGAAQQVAPEGNTQSQLANALERYDGVGDITVRDLADEVESIDENEVPETIRTAFEAYREALNEDFTEHAGRGDVEPFENAFVESIRNAVSAKQSQEATKETQPKPTKSKTVKPSFPEKEEIINQFSKTSGENEATALLGKLYMQAASKEENLRLRDAYREWQGMQKLQPEPTPNVPPTTAPTAPQEPVAQTVQPTAPEQAGSQDQETQTKGEVKETQGKEMAGQVAKTKPKRNMLPAEREFFDAHGTTIKEALESGLIRKNTQFKRDGTEKVTGYSPASADSYDFKRAIDAANKEKELRALAKASKDPDLDLREQVWSKMTDTEKRTVRQNPKIFDKPDGALDWEFLEPYAKKHGVSVPAEVLAKYPGLNQKPPTPDATATVTPERVPPTSGEPANQTQTTAEETTQAQEEVAPQSPIGMGGAVKDEFGPKAKFTAGMKAESIDADRAKRGLPPLVKAMRESDESVWQQAMAMIDNDWNAPAELLRSIQQTPRVLTPVEMMLMLYYKVDLKNTFDKLDREMQQAQADGRAEAAEAAREERDRKQTILNDLEKAVGIGDTGAATMAGRALRAYRLVMNEDFSLAEMTRRFETSAGRKATEEEMAELRAHAANWKRKADEQSALLDAHEKNDREDALNAAFERAKREAQQQPRYSKQVLDKVEAYAKKWDDRSAKALERIKARMKGNVPPGGTTAMHSGPGIDPALFDDLVEFGVGKIIRGTVSLASWTEEIVAEVGEWFKEHAQAVYDASQKRLGTDSDKEFSDSTPATKRQAKEAVKKGKTVPPEVQIERIANNLRKKNLAELETPQERIDAIRYATRRLARLFVEQGVTKRDELVDKLFEAMSPAVPNLTIEETRDAFSGYGTFHPPSKEAVDVILRDLRSQLQQVGKLEDMAKGMAPKATGFGRGEMSDEARALVKQVEEAKKKGGYTVTDPEKQLRTALQAVQRRLENQISDLQKEIDTRQKIIREPRKLQYDETTLKLKARRDELKAIHDQVFAKPEMTDAERLEKWKTNIRRRISDYNQRLADRDFLPRKKPEPPRLDQEAIRLRFEMHKIHRAVMDMRLKAELAKRTRIKKLIDGTANVIRFSRAVMTGGEFSAVLRQGGLMAMSHPIVSARAIAPMFKAFMSEQGQFRVQEDIQTRPNSPLYQKAGLEFTEAGVRLSTMEEHYMFRVSERLKKVPGINMTVKVVEAFQRAYTTYLNLLRADAFDVLIEANGSDIETAKTAANYINVTTGRGSTGLGKWIGPGANTVFFAPRYSISRFQFLTLQPIFAATSPTARKMMLKEYGKVMIGASVLVALGLAAGADIEEDPRSSDFGKLRFGKTRIDPFAGFLQASRLLATAITGWRKNSKGKLMPIRDEMKMFPARDTKTKPMDMTGMDVLANFTRTKLSPTVGATVSAIAGKDPTGQKFKLSDVVVQSFTPITYGDILKTMEEHGVEKGTAMGVLALFGIGLQTYDENSRRRDQ